jgi:hypothetical protein
MRIIVSWWAIAMSWIFLFPIALLMGEKLKKAYEETISFTYYLWNGSN